jgi:hypothetical protein
MRWRHSWATCVRGFVKMSTQLVDEGTFSIWMVPLKMWSQRWWYFREMWLVWGLCWESLRARAMQALLSLYMWEGGSLDCGFRNNEDRGPCWLSTKEMQWSRINSLVEVLMVMYSASVVLRTILDCRLLPQWIVQPQKVMTKPVWNRMQFWRCALYARYRQSRQQQKCWVWSWPLECRLALCPWCQRCSTLYILQLAHGG